MKVWDQASISVGVIQEQTELEPPYVPAEQEIIGIWKIMQAPGPLSRFHDSEQGSAWEFAF